MQLDDVGLGNRRITVGGHVRPLDDLTHRAVLDWLEPPPQPLAEHGQPPPADHPEDRRRTRAGRQALDHQGHPQPHRRPRTAPRRPPARRNPHPRRRAAPPRARLRNRREDRHPLRGLRPAASPGRPRSRSCVFATNTRVHPREWQTRTLAFPLRREAANRTEGSGTAAQPEDPASLKAGLRPLAADDYCQPDPADSADRATDAPDRSGSFGVPDQAEDDVGDNGHAMPGDASHAKRLPPDLQDPPRKESIERGRVPSSG